MADEHSANPRAGDIDPSDLERLKGDVIGNTLYSESFVLKTLLSLKSITWNSDLENDLCVLWDMTTDNDVVDYLLRIDFLTLLCTVIYENADNSRLVEILVGILGNMCRSEDVVRELFTPESSCCVDLLIGLTKTEDTETLLQLIRTLTMILHTNSGKLIALIQKQSEFYETVGFIMANSTNFDLKLGTLKLFHSLLYFLTNDTPQCSDRTFISQQLIANVHTCYMDLSDSADIKICNAYVEVLLNLLELTDRATLHDSTYAIKHKFVESFPLLLHILRRLADEFDVDMIEQVISNVKMIMCHLKVFNIEISLVMLRLFQKFGICASGEIITDYFLDLLAYGQMDEWQNLLNRCDNNDELAALERIVQILKKSHCNVNNFEKLCALITSKLLI